MGKKADIILLDGCKPHLWPPVMALNRITHFANAADVDTVIVDGRILMEERKVPHLDLGEVLAEAEAEADRAFALCGRADARRESPQIWRQARRVAGAYRAAGSEDQSS